jgi:hypothetical protein
MEYEVREIVNIMENLLERNDGMTAWYLQSEFSRIWNAQKPDSVEREVMAAVWKKMMLKWH